MVFYLITVVCNTHVILIYLFYIAENLKKVIIDQAIDLSRLQNNLQARRTQTRANRERNNIILQKQKDLVEHK